MGRTYLVKRILKALFDDELKAAEEPDYAFLSL
jgi:hypothetical protein